MNSIQIFGASIFDVCFGLELPDVPEIVWNVTKLNEAAGLGKFGSPVELRIDALPPLDLVTWKNLDRKKVRGIMANANQLVDYPDWHNPGSFVRMPLIATPITTVVFQHNDLLHAVIVDGNHRFTARTLLGFEHFRRFEVYPEVEHQYRITLKRS